MRSKHAFALMVLLLSGCAFIKNGTTQKVTFETMPPKAEVWLNGQKYPDLTPTTIELPRGEVAYEIRKKDFDAKPGVIKTRTSGYFYWSLLMGFLAGGLDMITGAWLEFDIPEEDKETVKITLEPSLDSSINIVAISSNPKGASINIDGLDLQVTTGVRGKGATRVDVNWKGPNDQERKITMSYLGYQTVTVPLRRGTREVHKELVPNPVEQKLEFLSTPPDADVYLDGAHLGKTPARKTMEWAFGDNQDRTVEFRLNGYLSQKRMITDKADKTITVTLTEVVATVPVKVDCVPAEATLEVDGKLVGDAPKEIKLDWSVRKKNYKLKFSCPGFDSKVVDIDEAKRSEPVTIRLIPSIPKLP